MHPAHNPIAAGSSGWAATSGLRTKAGSIEDLRPWAEYPTRRYRRGVPMFQVRIHGRGGQGVVTAAEMLSIAAFTEGRHAQAFPTSARSAPARRWSPSAASDRPIRLREPIVHPDAVIIQDPTLLRQIDVLSDLDDDGYLLVNSAKSAHQLGIGEIAARLRPERLITVPGHRRRPRDRRSPTPQRGTAWGFRCAHRGDLAASSLSAAIRATFSGASPTATWPAQSARTPQCSTRSRGPGPGSGDGRCSSRLRGREPLPRRWPSAVPRSSAPTRSRHRPTSSRSCHAS